MLYTGYDHDSRLKIYAIFDNDDRWFYMVFSRFDNYILSEEKILMVEIITIVREKIGMLLPTMEIKKICYSYYQDKSAEYISERLERVENSNPEYAI